MTPRQTKANESGRVHKMQFVDDHFNVKPFWTPSGSILLRAGKRSKVLSRGGTLTAAGRHWEQRKSQRLDLSAPEPYMKGSNEYIRLNEGKENFWKSRKKERKECDRLEVWKFLKMHLWQF